MALEKIQAVTGRGVYVAGDDIDTDQIIPARFLLCVTFDALGGQLFYDARFERARGVGPGHDRGGASACTKRSLRSEERGADLSRRARDDRDMPRAVLVRVDRSLVDARADVAGLDELGGAPRLSAAGRR